MMRKRFSLGVLAGVALLLLMGAYAGVIMVGQGSTTSGQPQILAACAATTGAPTDTTADSWPLSCDTAGGLRVDGSGATQPVSGTFWQATQPVSGTFWQATQPVSGTFWQTTQPVSGTVAATESGSWTVTANATGNTPVLENALSTTVQTVASGAATLECYYISNPNASQEYVQIFDISGSVTLGSSTPKWSVAVPAGQAANLCGMHLSFANAIKVAATTTATGASAPSTALDGDFAYH